MGKVFCFGELLMRMSPSLNGQWIKESNMPVYIGGAELNVAAALATWQIPVKYVTALPDHYLSKEIISDLETRNIDTSAVHYCGSRIGVYYLPQGTDLKNAGVIYDRAYSSFSSLKPGMIDWEKALEGCSWFHFSAISPALNENVAAVCAEALAVAAQKKIIISVDLNYRAKLWQYGKQPAEVMPALLNYCNVIMGNMWAAESLLGIPSPISSSAGKSKEELITAAYQSIEQLQHQFPSANIFAYTFRLADEYFAVLQKDQEKVTSKLFHITDVVDRVGSGDCFMGGLIYGLYNKNKAQHIINYAAAAAIGKLKIKGDVTSQTVQSILTSINQ